MARKKSAEATPDPGTQPAAEPEPTAQAAITKAEAVRRALAAGMEGGKEGSAYIEKEFGLEVTPQHFSATKAQLKGRAAGSTAKRGRPAAEPKPAKVKAAKPTPRQAELEQVVKDIQPAVGGSVFSDLAAIKSMVERLGVDEVKSIAELFG